MCSRTWRAGAIANLGSGPHLVQPRLSARPAANAVGAVAMTHAAAYALSVCRHPSGRRAPLCDDVVVGTNQEVRCWVLTAQVHRDGDKRTFIFGVARHVEQRGDPVAVVHRRGVLSCWVRNATLWLTVGLRVQAPGTASPKHVVQEGPR
jgi:hypothetical protein